jgi:hypothetical protein
VYDNILSLWSPFGVNTYILLQKGGRCRRWESFIR